MKPPLSKKKKIAAKKETTTKSSTVRNRVLKQKPGPGNDVIKTGAKIQTGKLPASFTIVAIGASAGGLEAVTQFLKNISPTTGMAFIYVQHLSPDHKSLLTSILSKVTAMKVQEIDDMEKMIPDNVYIIPHDKEIEVTDGHIKLIPRPKNKTSNLSIDVLFSSLAYARKENVIGIVLSGSASDGTRGLKEIKEAGGITFAQDDTAKFTSMPHSAIAEGVVDFILSPKAIATELNWMSKHPLVKRSAINTAPEDEIENSNPDLKIILELLHKKKNTDFSHYKMNTIKRRMLRRMLIHKIKTLKQYAELLVKKNDEVDLLYQDLLINVTGFFRDKDAFEFLKKSVLPRLLKSKSANETLRIWVAGCATGEEVYSIAMLLRELQGTKTNHIPFQIFASDLSAKAINEARNGEYSLQQVKNVTPKRLQQFFTKSNDKYRISKSLRDVCVFAQHNILLDPPFSRIDFISCRNLLIYLDKAAQKKAITIFHYALNENGCLMLGKSETIGTSEEFFTSLNKKFKIYSRKKNSGAFKIPKLETHVSHSIITGNGNPKTAGINVIPKKINTATHVNISNAFDAALLENYLPASVIINYDLDILQFRGATEMYLQNNSGKASFNILRMARPEITFDLRNAIHRAIKTKQIVSRTGIEMNADKKGNVTRLVNFEISPLKVAGEEPMLMIVFTGQQMDLFQPMVASVKSNSMAKDRRIKKMEDELTAARADMSSIAQEQEEANEELQSANEEIVSSNEELQSLNEELETSKEEIESTNEELITSNNELLARNQQIEQLYTYSETILAAIHEPMLILDKDMRIKSANKSFYKTFHVSEDESVGISLYNLGNNQWDIPRLRELLEDILPNNNRFHNFEVEHTFPSIGHKIMLLNAHRIAKQNENEDVIVLTILDITEIRKLALKLQLKERKELQIQLEADKKAMKLVEASNKRYSMMFMKSPFAFAILKGKDMVITLANESIKEMWGKGSNLEGKALLDVLPELKDGPIPELLNNVYTKGIPYQGYELLVPLRRNGVLDNVYFNFAYQPYQEADETISGVTVIAYEVSKEVIVKEELIAAKKMAEHKIEIAEEALKAKQQFLSNMSHEIRTPLNAIIGFTKVVLKTDLTAKQKEYISAIKTGGDTLIVLINDILDLAKVDAGKMTFEQTPFIITACISDMLRLFETKIQESNLELETEFDQNIPEIVMGDPMRLGQIILNLLSNAVKFTPNGKIKVNMHLLSEADEKVTIQFTVADTGIGIDEMKLTTIFENFQQASTGISKIYGGSGLGLAIVKQLVELQGGSISVKSKVGEGSVFSFILSFAKTNAKVEVEENKIEFDTEIKSINVLVVEDIALNQLLIKTLLDDFGFKNDIAANGKIAIEKIKTQSYDIILMDLQMPVMNGFEATDYIRNTLNLKIPIIALTADVTTMDLKKCQATGMNDYIAKPIDEKILYNKIIGLLKNSVSAELLSDNNGNAKNTVTGSSELEKLKCVDLSVLTQRTKSNPDLMMEMIAMYLQQTPSIINVMKQSLKEKNWNSLYHAVHKLIPSFAIMGIDKEKEAIAKKVQEYVRLTVNDEMSISDAQKDEIHELVLQLENICVQACNELQEEFTRIKNTKKQQQKS